MDKTYLCICENYYEESLAILNNNCDSAIELLPMNAACGFDNACKNMIQCRIDDYDPKKNYIVFGTSACLGLDFRNAPNIKLVDEDNCLKLITGSSLYEKLQHDGSFIVMPAWLRRWQERISEGGFDKASSRLFFRDSFNRIAYIDTGTYEGYKEELDKLSSHTGLEYQVYKTDLDLYALNIKHLCCDHKMTLHKDESNRQIIDLRQRNADYAVFFNIAKTLYDKKNGVEVIDEFTGLLKLLFAPDKCQYWSSDDLDDMKKETGIENFLEGNNKFMILDNNNGFIMKFLYGKSLIGLLRLEGFKFPDYFNRYLDFTLNISDVLSIAYMNAMRFEKICKANENLEYISYHDTMTGLHNRQYYNDMINRLKNHDSLCPFCIFFCDIDNLKTVNDSLGHEEGDRLIIKAADILDSLSDDRIDVMRIGGDEFAIIICNTDMNEAETIKSKINTLIDESNSTDDLPLSLSKGYALGSRSTVKAACRNADKNMYIEKFTHKMS